MNHYNKGEIEMNKIKIGLLLFLFIGLPLTQMTAQEVLRRPEPPRAERYEYLYDISKEKEAEYLNKLDKDLKADLQEMKKFDKEKYYELLMETQYSNFRVMHLNAGEKEIYDRQNKISNLEIKTEVLAFKYQQVKASDKANIKSELKTKLGELFELREKDRQYQIAELEKELEELKVSMDYRKKNKELVISRRMQELLGEDKYLDWD